MAMLSFKRLLLPLIFLVAIFALVLNLFMGVSANPEALPSQINAYVQTQAIRPAPGDDNVLEGFATSKRAQLLVGYTFYNLLFDARRAIQGPHYKSIGINEKYVPHQLSVYFLDPERDSSGLLKQYDVYNARSFPKLGLVLVNLDFVKRLLQMQPYMQNLTNDSIPEVDAQSVGHQGDQIILKLKEPVEGADPWQLNETFTAQALFICMYIVIHEIGHIHDYDQLGDEKYYQKPAKLREEYADHFFASLFAGLSDIQEFEPLYETAFFMGTNGMLTYMSHQLVETFGKTEIELYRSGKTYELKDSILSSHPPLAHRLMQVLYFIFEERNRREGKQRFTDESVYETLLQKVQLRRSLMPW
jgi:hypothetical protein